METDSKSATVVYDRRQIYRPFIERLSPIASTRDLVANDLMVARDRDPRNPDEPPIHVAFADSAELNRGSQMALVGGIGSGKTTELLLTQQTLSRHNDAINILIDLANDTDLSELNTGAILAAVGMRLYSHLKRIREELPGEVVEAHAKLRELAFGKTTWASADNYDDGWDGEPIVRVDVPGLMRLRFPALRRDVKTAKELLLLIAAPLREEDAQITVLIDGLDRLIRVERFREYAEQDLQALREAKMTAIVAAPLLLWYDKSRFLQDYFDLVKHIPAVASDPADSAFLKQILERRGAEDLMDPSDVSSIAKNSGGVLRDLLTLAQSAAQYAYRDDRNRIGRQHVRAAIKQLGNRYLVGLGRTHRLRLRQLAINNAFPIDDSAARELLVNRQVLEYFRGGREFFAVHPALAKALPKSE